MPRAFRSLPLRRLVNVKCVCTWLSLFSLPRCLSVSSTRLVSQRLSHLSISRSLGLFPTPQLVHFPTAFADTQRRRHAEEATRRSRGGRAGGSGAGEGGAPSPRGITRAAPWAGMGERPWETPKRETAARQHRQGNTRQGKARGQAHPSKRAWEPAHGTGRRDARGSGDARAAPWRACGPRGALRQATP